MSLNLFYNKVINNLGLSVDEDGYIFTGNGNEKVLITQEGKNLVLPTNENLNSVFQPDEDGNLVTTKCIFNPLNEDVIKGDSPSLKKMKGLAERRLGHVVAMAGELLLTLASNGTLQKKTPIQINKFLKRVREANSQGVKQIVDETTIDNWAKIYKKSLNKPQGMFAIYLKKSGVYNGEKFNRLATLRSPAYDELLAIGDAGKVFDITLRKKDVAMFKVIFQYLIPEFESDDIVSIGSNDGESPAFISLMSIYNKVVKRTNMVFKALAFVNKQVSDSGIIEDLIEDEELASLEQYLPELRNIPNEQDINRSMMTTPKQEKRLANMEKLSQTIQPQRPGVPSMVQPGGYPMGQSRIPEQPVQFNQQSGGDPLMKALGGRPVAQQAIGVPMGVNQPMMIQQPMMQPMVQPMVSNQMGMMTPNGLFQQQALMQPVGRPIGLPPMYR